MNTLKLIIFILLFSAHSSFAQQYISSKSTVGFFSEAPMENIEAQNSEGQSAFDASNGEVVFRIPIKGFEFEKSLMQEHFNENYLESEKYPYGIFKGKITGYDTEKEGKQMVKASGTMTIHGVEQPLKTDGMMKFQEDKLHIEAKFPIEIANYEIEIPKVVFYNIAEVVDVTVEFDYKKR